MKKRNNPFAESARKVAFVVGVICWRYASAVNRQRAREGRAIGRIRTFRPHPRAWGRKIIGGPLVTYQTDDDETERLYLEVKIQSVRPHYFDAVTGSCIHAADLQPFFRKRETESHRQGVAKQIILRDYRLDHIAELTLNGTRYTIAPAATELQHYFPKAKAAGSQSGRARHATSKRQPAKGAT